MARRSPERARVSVREPPLSLVAPDGAVTSKQTADVAIPRWELERIWSPEYLERLARTYWRFLERISLGLLRVLYTPSSREIVLIRHPLVLFRFRAPEYEIAEDGDGGAVTWRIDRGLLVIPRGRGRGFLRIAVRRSDRPARPSDLAAVTVTSEVANFYPMIAGSGRFSRVGGVIYRATQLRMHVIVTNAFMRSLARLDLVPSVVGALEPASSDQAGPPEPEGSPPA